MVLIGHDGQVIIWDMFAAVKLKVFQIKVSCFVIITITACMHVFFSFFCVFSSISLSFLSSLSLSSSMRKRVFLVYLIANGRLMVSLVQLLIVSDT